MEASDSLPKFREWIFFIPFPFPNFGNGFFSFPSRSRIPGMDFFHSLPVPEFREWIFSIPFPFPNPQKSFPLTPAVLGCTGLYWDVMGRLRLSGLTGLYWAALRQTLNWCDFIYFCCHFIDFWGQV